MWCSESLEPCFKGIFVSDGSGADTSFGSNVVFDTDGLGTQATFRSKGALDANGVFKTEAGLATSVENTFGLRYVFGHDGAMPAHLIFQVNINKQWQAIRKKTNRTKFIVTNLVNKMSKRYF